MPGHATIEDISEVEIFAKLRDYDQAYFDGRPWISDEEYDNIRLYAQRAYPANVYFTGVGSAERGGKIDLPYKMGSLNQVQIGEIEDWVSKNGLDMKDFIISDKLDGVSGMVVYGATGLQIAYSRGDGIQGADYTRHVNRMSSVPEVTDDPMVVRGEFIIQKARFADFKEVARTRAGTEYKNPRNALAGKLNASENPPEIYDFIDFLAYEIVGSDLSKDEQFAKLSENGFMVPNFIGTEGFNLKDGALAALVEGRGYACEYEIDGIVIEVNDSFTRGVMTAAVKRDTLNPAYAVKYKVADASNMAESEVIEVEWNISKHGYLKPRVRIEPVEIQGTTVQYATGFNAKFVFDNEIGYGAKVLISRQGDVIPNIIKVLAPGMINEPDNWYWSDNQVDAISQSISKEQILKSQADFFEKIGAPLLRYKSIDKLNSWGFNTVERIIRMSRQEMVSILGKNGEKAYDGLHAILQDIPGHLLAGAYSIERGIGVRKMKKLFDHYGNDLDEIAGTTSLDIARDVESYDEKTAEAAVAALRGFFELMETCEDFITIQAAKSFDSQLIEGMKFCFTGYRNKQLQQVIEDAGGAVGSSVSKNTTYVVAKDVDSTSGKAKKGRDLGIPVIDEAKLIQILTEAGLKI